MDYRKLNSVTKKDCFPQPSTEELLQRLDGHRFYTKLTLKSGYFQLPIHENIKKKLLLPHKMVYVSSIFFLKVL